MNYLESLYAKNDLYKVEIGQVQEVLKKKFKCKKFTDDR